MRITNLVCLVAFTLLCVGLSTSAHAQYGFNGGGYTTNPSPLTAGGVTCDDSTCTCNLTGVGSFTASYSTQLDWTGEGEAQYATTLYGTVSVSGSSGYRAQAHCSGTVGSPINVSRSGGSSNGVDNYPTTSLSR